MKMAVQDGGGKDELKTQFITREGTYRLMTLSEYSRPNRVGYTNTQGSAAVRVSFVTLPDPSGNGDRICFNFGRELYVYVYKGVKKATDLTKPVDKKMYKGTNPTCHDFNMVTMTPDSVSLVVGFSTGQIQLIDPIKKELSKLYNEERLIDKTKVTCIRWVPGSTNLFLVSHSSGQLYLYNEELPCGTAPPHYQPFKQGDGYAIHTCKTKSTRNPLYRWVIGSEGCCINEFAFSPCGAYLAVVSQDGFLRVFHYDTMELLGSARSYFGGFLCVCWSPDGRYVVVGGEDDLVTVWSFHERRVVARGQGHRSWVSVVAFDPYTTSYSEQDSTVDFSGGSDDETAQPQVQQNHTPNPIHNCTLSSGSSERSSVTRNSGLGGAGNQASNRNSSGSDFNRMNAATCYRLGSVGQDTQLCLWDITEDVLRQPMCSKLRTSGVGGSGNFGGSGTFGVNGSASGGTYHLNSTSGCAARCNNVSTTLQTNAVTSKDKECLVDGNVSHFHGVNMHNNSSVGVTAPSLTQRLAGLGFGDRKDGSGTHKRNFSLASRGGSTGGDKNNSSYRGTGTSNRTSADDPMRLIGTGACPRFDECPVLEPLICKKIAHERLTALVFREDCFVTACQDGYVYTWARPGKMCTDKRVSRNHGLVKLSDNGDIILIATHTNPFFYTKAEESVVQLNKGNSVILHNGDELALLPDSYRFRVVIPQETFTEDKQNVHNENDQSKDIPMIIKKEQSFHQETVAEDNQNKFKENNEAKNVSIKKEEQSIDKDEEREIRDLDIENMNSSTNQCETSCDEKRNLPSWMTALEKDNESGTETSCSSRTVSSRKRKTVKCDTAVKKRGKRNPKNNTSDKHGDDSDDIHSDNETENKENPENVKCHEMSDDVDDDDDDNNSRDNDDNRTNAQKVNVDLKSDEPRNDDQAVNTVGVSASAVDDQGTTSKQTRQTCMYGAKCYRRNQQHRTDFSHPGDSDYDDKDLPECSYGVTCYRKNKQHRLDFKHTTKPRKAKQQTKTSRQPLRYIPTDTDPAPCAQK
ncbi:WD repeat-containing protein 20-like isoform X3 [Periplaneta americana]|uniref:WD repeat-containing protein 20-like isoform X3 n=1 Tax=Periplaneta americana TaxID=6978 RepID=UPI0037E88671